MIKDMSFQMPDHGLILTCNSFEANVSHFFFSFKINIRDGSGEGQEAVLDLLAFQSRSGGSRAGIDRPLINKCHLGIGAIVCDDGDLLLFQHAGLDHHGQGIRTDLMANCRGDHNVRIFRQIESVYFPGLYNMGIPFGGNHPQGLQFPFPGISQVPELNPLKKGKLNGVAADRQSHHLVFFNPQVIDDLIYRMHHNLMGSLKADLQSKMKVVDDVGPGQGVPGGYRGSQNNSALIYINCMSSKAACT
jgi:hypothetical protein